MVHPAPPERVVVPDLDSASATATTASEFAVFTFPAVVAVTGLETAKFAPLVSRGELVATPLHSLIAVSHALPPKLKLLNPPGLFG
jgi:hypothetical protein